MKKRKILLLEDDILFADTLLDYLTESSYDVDVAYNGEEALEKTYTSSYDLYLFDINVPKLNGIELLDALRKNNIQTPTIFLTSHKDDAIIQKCFVSGCDDYLRKPFHVPELLLRMEAVLKRTSRASTKTQLTKEIYYDFDNRKVFNGLEEVQLPIKVIQLLEIFIESDNKTVTTKELLSRLWSTNEDASEGSLRLYIAKIRSIVGKEKIINVKRVGYSVQDIVLHE